MQRRFIIIQDVLGPYTCEWIYIYNLKKDNNLLMYYFFNSNLVITDTVLWEETVVY